MAAAQGDGAGGQEVVAWLRGQATFKGARRRVRLLASPWPQLDALLGGGVAAGEVTEIGGRGGASLALALAGAAIARGEWVAWVDLADSLDARCADAVAGGERFLWVRPSGQGRRRLQQALKAADLLLEAGGFTLVVLDLTAPQAPPETDPPNPSRTTQRPRSLQVAVGHALRLAQRARKGGSALLLLGHSFGSASGLRLASRPIRRHDGVALQLEVARRRHGAPGGRVVVTLIETPG